MSRGLYLTAGFILGTLAGSGLTWYLLKDKYETDMNEDFQARREAAAAERREEKKKEEPKESVDVGAIHNKPSIMEYAEKLNKEGYVSYTNTERPIVKDREPDNEAYVIPPETFDEGDDLGYEKISMTYYSDGVVADDADDILEDVEKILGDFAEHYGDYEDDVVYVRNESQRVDYEICKDNRTYEEVSGKKPHRVEI